MNDTKSKRRALNQAEFRITPGHSIQVMAVSASCNPRRKAVYPPSAIVAPMSFGRGNTSLEVELVAARSFRNGIHLTFTRIIASSPINRIGDPNFRHWSVYELL